MWSQRFLTALFGCALALAGCAAEPGEAPTVEDNGEGTTDDSDVVSRPKYHYAPRDVSVAYKPGCGVRPTSPRVCERGLFVAFTPRYADLKADAKVEVKGTKMTIRLDTWSSANRHIMVVPEEQSLKLDDGEMQLNTEYEVKIVSWKGVALAEDTVQKRIAM
jgi:hypothetical protein